jgi:radical SAM superfamily enzyme YgiQ (UPF0313 family)
MILMGIEAENPEALKEMGKKVNLKRGVPAYPELFRRMHKHGIGILATMIFGMDNDKKEDFLARRDFIVNSSIDTYQCTILTPLPGTELFERFKNEDRIRIVDYPQDWQQYDGMMATVNTLNLERRELDEIMKGLWMSLYNKVAMRRKMFRTLWNTMSFRRAYLLYATSHNYGRMFLERYFDTEPDGVGRNFEWKNRKRPLYLKITDKILWVFYLISWNKIAGKFK